MECSCTAVAVAGGSVWGSGPYTSDSRACRAARHTGAVPLGGGVVRIEMGPGQARHPGTTRNGVQSIDYGAYQRPRRAAHPGGGCPRAMPGQHAGLCGVG